MKDLKLRIIMPLNTDEFNKYVYDSVSKVIPSNVDLDIRHIGGPDSFIEYRYNLMQKEPYVVKAIIEAQNDGVDGVFVSDMDFCGVEVAREVVDIPVIGGFRPSAFTAMSLAQKFSIITVTKSIKDYQIEHIRAFGINENMASIRSTVIDVELLSKMYIDPKAKEKVVKIVSEECLNAILNDGADAIIFGCTGFVDIAEEVYKVLLAKGYNIPVLDPNKIAINFLYNIVSNRLMQSRITYCKYEV